MKYLIEAILKGQCAGIQQQEEVVRMVHAILKHVPDENLDALCKDVVEASGVNLGQLTQLLVYPTIATELDSLQDENSSNDVKSEILKSIVANDTPVAVLNKFIQLVEEAETSIFMKNIINSGLSEISDYALSVAEFGNNIVTQTRDSEQSDLETGIALDQGLSWYNSKNENLDEDEEHYEDLIGSFYVSIDSDGLTISASADGEEVAISNIDVVLNLTAKVFNIPKSLIS